jgi:hypothetical protein
MKLVFALLLGLVACSKGRAPGAPPPMGPHAHDPEIETLDREIGDALAKMQLARPQVVPGSAPDLAMSSKVNVTAAEDPACKRGAGDTCTQSCTLADSICKNAKRICEIASKLGNDPWANDKCTGGTESCRVAHENCCNCT